jgi:hypothetical protein
VDKRKKLNPTIVRSKKLKKLNSYNLIEDQIYKSLIYAKLQSCIGEGKSSLLGACCIILSPKTFGHHFWPSLIPLRKSEGIKH